MKSMRTAAVLAVMAGGLVLGGGGAAFADSDATGAAFGSPGVLSGNVIEIPIDIPVDACGDSVNVLGLLDPASGSTCINASSHRNGRTRSGGMGSERGGSEHRGGSDRHGSHHKGHGDKGDDC
jgi:hypothetical protein